MSWADQYISKLTAGQTVQFRPRGNSMLPKIKSGALVTVVPATTYDKPLYAGDIVLCRVRGRDYLHLIKAVKGPVTGPQYLIGNNRGGLNGWIHYTQIYGVCTQVEN